MPTDSTLYGTGTGGQETFPQDKVNMRIHTNSSSGKSIATRIRTSKKAIEPKYLFIQQLVQVWQVWHSGNSEHQHDWHARQPLRHTYKV